MTNQLKFPRGEIIPSVAHDLQIKYAEQERQILLLWSSITKLSKAMEEAIEYNQKTLKGMCERLNIIFSDEFDINIQEKPNDQKN